MNDSHILVRRFSETHIDLQNETGIEFVTKVSGKYLVEICRDGKVIRQPFGPQMRPNLLTNTFFDSSFTGSGTSQFRIPFQYAHVGTGTTTPANTDIKLTTPSQSVNTLFTGGGNTFSNDTTNGAWTGTWVFEFAAVGAGVTYNEAGLNSSSSTTSGLTSHLLFPASVTLNSGDNLRLTYSITYSMPCLVTPIAVSLAAVNGFNVSGNIKMVGPFANFFGTVSTANTAVTTGGSGSTVDATLMFGTAATGSLGSAPTTFPTVNSALSFTNLGNGTTGSLATYTNGSFTRNQTISWTPSQPASTVSNVNNILLLRTTFNEGLLLVLTATQTKANTNTLAITLSCTMARA